MQQHPVRRVEMFLRERSRPKPVLIADHDKPIPGILQPQQCRNHAGHQPEFFQRIDLLVFRLLDQAAVAVDEKDFLIAHEFHSRMKPISALFSSGAPTVIRTQSASPGCADWSRRRMPAAAASRTRRGPSTARTSTKFAAPGQIFTMPGVAVS